MDQNEHEKFDWLDNFLSLLFIIIVLGAIYAFICFL